MKPRDQLVLREYWESGKPGEWVYVGAVSGGEGGFETRRYDVFLWLNALPLLGERESCGTDRGDEAGWTRDS